MKRNNGVFSPEKIEKSVSKSLGLICSLGGGSGVIPPIKYNLREIVLIIACIIKIEFLSKKVKNLFPLYKVLINTKISFYGLLSEQIKNYKV